MYKISRIIQSKIRPLFVFLENQSVLASLDLTRSLAVVPASCKRPLFPPHPLPSPPSPSFQQLHVRVGHDPAPVRARPGQDERARRRARRNQRVRRRVRHRALPEPAASFTASSTGFFCFGAPPTVFFPAEGCTPGRDSQTSRTVVRESAQRPAAPQQSASSPSSLNDPSRRLGSLKIARKSTATGYVTIQRDEQRPKFWRRGRP